jgi:hypothetical protein
MMAKKERGGGQVLGERGGSASLVDLFQQRKPSPQFFSKKEGGGEDNSNLKIKMG